jgi:hypothetical protein
MRRNEGMRAMCRRMASREMETSSVFVGVDSIQRRELEEMHP